MSMQFSIEDLEPLKEAYDRGVRLHNVELYYKGKPLNMSYAASIIATLENQEQLLAERQKEEAVMAKEVAASIDLIQCTPLSEMVIINVELKGSITPVVCCKQGDKLFPLLLGITEEARIAICNTKIP